MDNLFTQFINESRYVKNLSEKTLTFYNYAYHYFKEAGAFQDLSKQSLQNAIIVFRQRGTATGGINAYIRGINVFLKWLHDEHSYENFSLKKIKGHQPILRSLTDDELKTIIKFKPKTFSEKRLHIALLLMTETGLRVDEVLNLQKSKIDFDNLLLSITGKGNKERIVPFSYAFRKILSKFSEKQIYELLFCTNTGGKVMYDNFLRDFNNLMKKLKIEPDGAFHAFRRTFATNYIRNGGNALVLRRLLGHSTLQQATSYVKLVTEDLQKEQHRTSILNRFR